MNVSSFLRVAAVGIPLVLLGCGSGAKTSSVSGKVTYKGKPVYTGVVNLYGPNNAFASGGIDVDGNYMVIDAPVGVVKVAVISEKPTSSGRSAKNDVGAAPAPGEPDPSKWSAIDAKYADAETSGKAMTLTGGKNTQDITLE